MDNTHRLISRRRIDARSITRRIESLSLNGCRTRAPDNFIQWKYSFTGHFLSQLANIMWNSRALILLFLSVPIYVPLTRPLAVDHSTSTNLFRERGRFLFVPEFVFRSPKKGDTGLTYHARNVRFGKIENYDRFLFFVSLSLFFFNGRNETTR